MNEFIDASVEMIINKVTSVLFVLHDYKRFTHSELEELVKEQLSHFDVSVHDERYLPAMNGIIDAYESQVGIKIYTPDIIVNDPNRIDWYAEAKKAKGQKHESDKFFDRYKAYLSNEGFDWNTINNYIAPTTEKILSRCANPKSVTREHIKGLVVGDVQSGKTANYLALANLAYDYGYKIVLILAGLTDSLRMQTQQRTDEGVIGAISDSIGNNVEFCGVGLANQEYYVIPFTNNSYDFAKFISQNLNAGVNDFNKPVILVVKKNRKILDSVIEKLQSATEEYESNSILIIDDEADNASVSTKKEEESPSAINKCIRDIFNKFPIASYVGYTATPFANIFINYIDEEDNLNLFPSDFIVQLRAPSTYFGGHVVFPRYEKSKYVRIIDPKEPDFLPVKHKKDDGFYALSSSMKEAILSFLINNVIRTIRGHEKKHRTMMINISRFNSMQSDIKREVDNYVDKIKRIIEQDSYLPNDNFIKNSEMKKLHDVFFDSFYDDIRNGDLEKGIKPITWEQIKNGLYSESQLLTSIIVNSRCKKEDRLNYDNYKNGARLIAIGGFVLSRGLTLEGLMVSYYSRNAGAYDVLLQMCRWFGYRPNYMDLCRIYLSNASKDCFDAVLEAVDNLKKQFHDMDVAQKRPKDFGLMVKQSPDTLETKSLLVTSRNKMYNGEDLYYQLNYGGVYADTSKIPLDKDINEHNIKSLIRFYDMLKENDCFINGNYSVAENVEKEKVADFFDSITISYKNRKFNTESLSSYTRDSELFDKWDVAIASGSSSSNLFNRFSFNGLFKAPLRSCEIDDDGIIRIGKGNNRLLDPNILNVTETLSDAEREEILKQKTESDPEHKQYKALTAKDYLKHRNNPMLIIYPLDLAGEQTTDEDKKLIIETFGFETPVIAFAVAFPQKESGVMVKYKMNKVMADKLNDDLKNADDEDEEEEYSYD